MGWRTGAYATVWAHRDKEGKQRVVDAISDRMATVRISISRKDKNTGEYNTEFSKFVKFIGTGAVRKAMTLKERDRIKLLEIDYYETPKVPQPKTEDDYYKNWVIYDFEIQDRDSRYSQPQQSAVDSGEVELDDDKLPF